MRAVVSHPTLFRGGLVHAIISNLKTVTRRVITQHTSTIDGPTCPRAMWDALDWGSDRIFVDPGPSPAGNQGPYLHVPSASDAVHRVYPRIQAGDTLWVKETWAASDSGPVYYAADYPTPESVTQNFGADWKWRPSIHMRREDSRLDLDVVSVRPERVHDITEADAVAEGLTTFQSARATFAWLWDNINSPRGYGWAANPWVWRIEFRRIK